MSLTTERQDIADVLTTIDGVTGFRYRPKVMNTGDSWPMLGDLVRGPATDFEVTWRIIVVLPPKEQDAMEWFDSMYEEIAESLMDFGYVERIEPGSHATEAGTKDIMILTLRKEA